MARVPQWISGRVPGRLGRRLGRGQAAPTLVVPRGASGDRFRLRDLLSEAAYGIGARPARLLLTILGTVLGIGSLVVTVGLAQTAAGQVARQFDAVAATQVVIEPASATAGADRSRRATGRIPWDVEDRLTRLAGIEHVGALSTVDIGTATVTAVPVNDPSAAAVVSPAVLAATPGVLAAVRGSISTGRWFDAGHDARADRVVVLGARAATRLGVSRVDRQPSVFIGDTPYTVIGVIGQVARRSDLLDSVVVPVGTARHDFALPGLEEAQVTIAVGAGPVVAEQAPLALDPTSPEAVRVQVPPPPSTVRGQVQADINAMFLALGGVALLVGGLGIANVTLLSVRERVGEIGLRRALGATTRDVARQFLAESAVVGVLGGLVGAAIGVLVVLGVSIAKDWTPILGTGVIALSVLLGGVIGLLAGTYPAVRAARVEPMTALRTGAA